MTTIRNWRPNAVRIGALLFASTSLALGLYFIAYSYVHEPERADAAIEEWTPGHSWIQENSGWSQSVTALGEINQSAWINHFNNAVGNWNVDISVDPFTWDWSFDGWAQVAVTVSDSWDEFNWNSLKGARGYTPAYDCWQVPGAATTT